MRPGSLTTGVNCCQSRPFCNYNLRPKAFAVANDKTERGVKFEWNRGQASADGRALTRELITIIVLAYQQDRYRDKRTLSPLSLFLYRYLQASVQSAGRADREERPVNMEPSHGRVNGGKSNSGIELIY